MSGHRGRTRRSFLRASGAGVAAVSAAGCLDADGGEDGDGNGGTGVPESGETEPDEIERGGSFTVGLPGAIEAPNPLTASSAYTWSVLELVHQTGVFVEPEAFEVMPWAFTEWDAEEREGRMTIRFSVNDDLRWTDGEAFTVDDALFTYEYYMDREPTRYRAAIDPIESVSEADNGFDVRLELSEAVGTWEVEQLGLHLLPRHVWEGVDDHTAHGSDEPVGLGPGRITRLEPDTAIDVSLDGESPLTRYDWVDEHDLFLAEGPYLDSIRFRVLDDAALHREFVAGNVDAIHDDAFDPGRTGTLEDRDGLDLIDGRADGYGHYTVNMRVTPFDDQAFRQAMRMAMDGPRWVREMARDSAVAGSVVVPPAYEHLRPETAADEPVQQSPDEEAHPALEALRFRGTGDGALDVEAVREFLRSGEVISGRGGTYAGVEYPGSLTDVGETAQTEAAYDYEFGEVRSDVLREAGADAELYVDGQTIEERNEGPLTMLNYPPDERPRVVEFTQEYVGNLRRLGVPIRQEIVTAGVMADRAFLEAEFDVHPMEWSSLSSQGADSLYRLFHSDNAHAADSTFDSFAYNASGYGLEGLAGADEEIDAMRRELDDERRDALVRRVAERLYLEAPTLVRDYPPSRWPVNAGEYAGFMADVPSPGSDGLWKQCLNVHRR